MSYKPDSAVTYIVIHYSATPIERNFTAADIDRMHRDRGFKEIGYHYFIRKDGTVETGRDLSQSGRFEVGAHSKGENSSSIGVCYEGGVRANAPTIGFDSRTKQQHVAMEALVISLMERFPRAIVKGHRDMPGAATQCPGFDAEEWWDQRSTKRASFAFIPEAAENVIMDADKPMTASTTNWAVVTGLGASVWQAWQSADVMVQVASLGVIAVLLYVFAERLRKAKIGKMAKEALGL